MKPIIKELMLKPVKEYFLMTVGMIMYSFAWIGCILPAKGVGGGAAGLSLVLCHAVEEWLGVSIQIGTMVFIINGILLLIAGFIIGWNFGVKTVYCVVVISLGMNFWQSVLPEGDFLHLERILSVILGGILAGMGVAMCFAQGGSTGGTDIIGKLLKLKFPWPPIGKLVMIPDMVVVILAAVVFGTVNAALYGLIQMYLLSKVMDMILYGWDTSRVAYIITDRWEETVQGLLDMNRGVTLLQGKGAYTGAEKQVLLVAFRQREIVPIKRMLREIDPKAFFIVCDAHEILGEGFGDYQKEEI